MKFLPICSLHIKKFPTTLLTPKNMSNAPIWYLNAMIADWLEWAPNDARGSSDYPTLESLRNAVDRAGYGKEAQRLSINV